MGPWPGGCSPPLHALFQECDRAGDLAGCLVIQCLIVECFAVAAYRAYLPVAAAYAQPITAAVLADEAEHLNYDEQWLQGRFAEGAEAVAAICRRALPVTLQILRAVGRPTCGPSASTRPIWWAASASCSSSRC